MLYVTLIVTAPLVMFHAVCDTLSDSTTSDMFHAVCDTLSDSTTSDVSCCV